MLFEDYINELPMLHTWNGNTWNSGGFDSFDLKSLYDFLRQHLPENSVLLETGAGNSTIMMLFLSPSRLISIAPDELLFGRIENFLQINRISDDALEKQVDGSQWILPKIAAENRFSEPILDFALIDGCHGWPTCFVDLEYINSMLKQGGYICIDDTQLYTVKEMAKFLLNSKHFSLELDMVKFLVFKKLTMDRFFGEFTDQPYTAKRSKKYTRFPNPYGLRLLDRIKITHRQIRKIKKLLIRKK
jgi:hypothetical protein